MRAIWYHKVDLKPKTQRQYSNRITKNASMMYDNNKTIKIRSHENHVFHLLYIFKLFKSSNLIQKRRNFTGGHNDRENVAKTERCMLNHSSWGLLKDSDG